MLDVRLLKTFVAVADHNGFAHAAESLALTPAAVSGHIKRLETNLNARLFVRTTRRVSMTPEGEILLSYARNIVGLEREALRRFRGDVQTGRLRIGATEDFSTVWLPRILQVFGTRYPGVCLELQTGLTSALLDRFESGDLDVVFGKHCSHLPVTGELLWREPLVWAFSSEEKPPEREELPLAVFPDSCVYRMAATEALDRHGLAWRVCVESTSLSGCMAAAESGLAVAPVAASLLSDGVLALGAREGLPPLPEVSFLAFFSSDNTTARTLVDNVKTVWARTNPAVSGRT